MHEISDWGVAAKKDQVIPYISQEGCNADDVLSWATSARILFVEGDSVQFIHQSLREYYAAVAWLTNIGDPIDYYFDTGQTVGLRKADGKKWRSL